MLSLRHILIITYRDRKLKLLLKKNNSVIYKPILTYYSHFTPKIKYTHLCTVEGRTIKCDHSNIRVNRSVEIYTIKSKVGLGWLRADC
jgi:hypothetical protein